MLEDESVSRHPIAAGSRSHKARTSSHPPGTAGAGGRGICGAKRIRSLYLPSPTGRPPGLSTRTPPKGPASVSTINGATMRLWQSRPPCLCSLIAAGSRSDRASPHRPYSSERRTATSAVAVGGSCIARARQEGWGGGQRPARYSRQGDGKIGRPQFFS